MKTVFTILSLISLIIIFSLSSCYYDNLEELNPKDTTQVLTCDTANSITYINHIKPIMDNYCTSCHGGNNPGGGIDLSTFAKVKVSAQTGKLLGSIVWDGSASNMPKGASTKIENCSIEKVKKWIATGYTQ